MTSSDDAQHEDAQRDTERAQAQDAAVTAYWQTARKRAGLDRLDVVVGQQPLGTVQPPAWSFGSDPQEADALLQLVLGGEKTATASAAEPYAAQELPPPVPGDLAIILDGAGRPRALIVTTEVTIVPFRDADAEHAAAEGEGDRSLAHWRRVHEPFFTAELAAVGMPFHQGSEIVLERFRLLDPKPPKRSTTAPEPATV